MVAPLLRILSSRFSRFQQVMSSPVMNSPLIKLMGPPVQSAPPDIKDEPVTPSLQGISAILSDDLALCTPEPKPKMMGIVIMHR